MIKNQEEDTNSKAFTAKTSCVRRRYSEFAWLKKKLQKNAGLVPVPDLPGKSIFSFSNEDFLERRRRGLQVFLDKVLHMTVCLSDSQLHLFLQTQLPVGHIQDCVQGHTPYTVTDAILTYASSNRGWAQAQEEDSIKEPSLTAVPYESMESPAPHLPSLQNKEASNPGLLSSSDPDPPDAIVSAHRVEIQLSHTEKSSLKVLQKDNHLQAIVEQCAPATFFLGDSQDSSPVEQTQQRSCQIQTPVEVHSPMGTGFEDGCEAGLERVIKEKDCTVMEERPLTVNTVKVTVPSAQSVPCPDTQEEASHGDSPGEPALENVSCETEVLEQHVSSEKVVERVISEDLESSEEQILEQNASSEQEVQKIPVCSEEPVLEQIQSDKQDLEQHASSEDHIPDVSCPEGTRRSDEQTDPDKGQHRDPGCTNETVPKSEISGETLNASTVPEVECGGDDAIHEKDTPLAQDQVKQEVDSVKTGNKEDGDEDNQSLPSSDGSIAKVSDEESICDEKEDTAQNVNGYMETSTEEVTHWLQVEGSSRGTLELQMKGYSTEKEGVSDIHYAQEETNRTQATKGEELPYITDTSPLARTLELESSGSAGVGDLTDHSDFSILESNCEAESADGKCAEQVTLSSLSLDASEESHEGVVH
ncbi:sorting nexin-11 isoform 2-T2 [Polymixia lowei]